MRKREVKVGEVYLAKLDGKLVPVRVEHAGIWGGWEVRNLETDSLLWILHGSRLRAAVKEGKNE